MTFCGQCGYQLRAGDNACPRCGMVTEPMITAEGADVASADSPTIASTLTPNYPPGRDWQANAPTRANTPAQTQPPLSYRPYDNAPVTNPSSYPGAPVSYPGYTPPPSGASYPGYAPGTLPPGGYNQQQGGPPRQNGRGRALLVALVVLLALALAGSFAWYFLYGRTSTSVNTPTPTAQTTTAASTPTPVLTPTQTTTLTPSQQAQALLQQYYTDVNNRDYQAAYSLLGMANQNSKPYAQFKNGYAHTRHDSITFNNIAPQSDGTVVVSMTIQATEDAASGGTQMSTYQGSYVVGQENGAWKILSGSFTKV